MLQDVQYGYFNFQGRGQIARLIMAYSNTPYQQTLYSFSKMTDWTQKDKQALGLDFPSLPYLIDANLKLTQSRAIQKYVLHQAKRADMLGKNIKQKAFIDNIDGVIRDIFQVLVSLISGTNFQESRKKSYQTISLKLNYLNSCIGAKNTLLSRITYPDFVLNVVFGYFRFFYPHEYRKWQNIERVYQHVNGLPQISAYYKSPEGICALLAPEWASNPKFQNFRPIHEQLSKLQQSAQVPIIQPSEEVRPKPIMVIVKQQRHIAPQDTEVVQQEKELPAIIKVQSTEEPKQFNARVQQYKKAVQTANKKSTTQLKQGHQKSTIVTPSKIDSSIKSQGNVSALWKVNTQENDKVINPLQTSSICLGYWGIRGLGQIQRHLLTYCGHQFHQKIYKTRQEWFNSDKITLNLPFPNLPYLISGNFKITQSLAIDRFIIRFSKRHELLGRNLRDETYIESFVKILSDMFAQIRAFCFTEDQQKKEKELLAKLNFNFKKIDNFAQNQEYTFGYLTWADFYIAEISYYIEKIFPQVYDNFTFLRRIRESVNSNQEIQSYYTRNGSISTPFMPLSAKISF